jgi:Cu/Ag efflux pump CusA
VLVRDLGSVRFGPDIRRGLLEWNGEGEAVGAVVVMRYGENARDVIARVKKKLDDLRPSLPRLLRRLRRLRRAPHPSRYRPRRRPPRRCRWRSTTS